MKLALRVALGPLQVVLEPVQVLQLVVKSLCMSFYPAWVLFGIKFWRQKVDMSFNLETVHRN